MAPGVGDEVPSTFWEHWKPAEEAKSPKGVSDNRELARSADAAHFLSVACFAHFPQKPMRSPSVVRVFVVELFPTKQSEGGPVGPDRPTETLGEKASASNVYKLSPTKK